ncbi:hypothetical protein [Neptuniibacter sp. QD37_11]|uniref:hypothetical protein n=1 Tax=Neptuniibacter sp. QD37_11 TaxID=3398209 RepID=UPI0039F48D59
MTFFKYNAFVCKLIGFSYSREQTTCSYFFSSVALAMLPFFMPFLLSGFLLGFGYGWAFTLGSIGFTDPVEMPYLMGNVVQGFHTAVVFDFVFNWAYNMGVWLSFCLMLVAIVAGPIYFFKKNLVRAKAALCKPIMLGEGK